MEKILTICLFPFEEGDRWTISVTLVSSIEEIEEIGADACESNTTIESHSTDSKEHAFSRAKLIAKQKGLPLYLHTVHSDGEDELTELEVNGIDL